MSDKPKLVLMYRGRPVDEMSRDDLLKAVRAAAEQIRALEDHHLFTTEPVQLMTADPLLLDRNKELEKELAAAQEVVKERAVEMGRLRESYVNNVNQDMVLKDRIRTLEAELDSLRKTVQESLDRFTENDWVLGPRAKLPNGIRNVFEELKRARETVNHNVTEKLNYHEALRDVKARATEALDRGGYGRRSGS